MKSLILASKSPRRRELMSQAGFECEIIPSTVEEQITKTIPSEVVEELSFQKAVDAYEKLVNNRVYTGIERDILVIGADTVVSIDGTILGKPGDRRDAGDMLRLLQGKTHQVYTGVTLVYNTDGMRREHTFFECTEVTFYPMSDEEIEEYIATGDCDDKAGSYGIQGAAAIYIEKINGDYNNVVGLPIARLYQELKDKKLL